MEYKKVESPSTLCGCIGSCATVYEQPWVQELLGESFHPGGMELTRRSIASLGLKNGSRVLDVASGTGVTAEALADSGFAVVGIDASEKQVSAATERFVENSHVSFRHASAENIPNDLGMFDGVFCECAFSLVSDKDKVAANWARVLALGGRLAISDMVVEGELPESLKGEMGSWACLGGARSREEYEFLLRKAGFIKIEYVDESEAVKEMISMLKKKLLVYGLGNLTDMIKDLGVSLPDLLLALKDAARAANSGVLSYGRFSASIA
ncbi:methyltransferase domain-containing protein [Puniceicoccaceae bacterium K14]|nr:methyltransferase domain-containing protein [Puniceicoccaceae bacterium K14]